MFWSARIIWSRSTSPPFAHHKPKLWLLAREQSTLDLVCLLRKPTTIVCIMELLGRSFGSMERTGATDSVFIAVGVFASGVFAAQLFTPADPVGKCFRFWKQLGAQVRKLVCLLV